MKQKTTAFVRVYVNKQKLNVFLRFRNSRRALFDVSPSTMPLASVGSLQSPASSSWPRVQCVLDGTGAASVDFRPRQRRQNRAVWRRLTANDCSKSGYFELPFVPSSKHAPFAAPWRCREQFVCPINVVRWIIGFRRRRFAAD